MTALTHHGGRLDAASRLYPEAAAPWIDLSTGINPVPWHPRGLPPIDWAALPAPSDLAELEASAARYFGAAAASVVAVPGTEVALRLLAHAGLPEPFHYVSPGYRTHAAAMPAAVPVAIAQAGATRGTLLLANPNNPDGRLLDRAAMLALAQDRWLIVDEAFADVDPSASIVPVIPPKTIVLRSFGKFFGLAGVRLGFVIGPHEIVARFRAMLGDWPVSSAAIAWGTAAYRDNPWIAAARLRLRASAQALDAVLQRHGFNPEGACPLFRLVRGAPTMFERLARTGILTRPFDYEPTWLRLGLPADGAALDRLDRALGDG